MTDKMSGFARSDAKPDRVTQRALRGKGAKRASRCRRWRRRRRFQAPRSALHEDRFPMPSLFDAVEMAPRDPILGLNEQFAADPNPAKVNLGVGVYYDENGKLPLLRCVRAAEQMLIEAPKPRGYLPIDGIAAYDAATQALVFGAEHPARKAGRIATVQAVGGTGGLKVGADLLQAHAPRCQGPDQRAELGEPPRAVRGRRLRGRHLPLLRPGHEGRRLRGDARRARGGRAGHDRRPARLLPQPDRLRPERRRNGRSWSPLLAERGLVPFLDMAYQGFGDGIAEDGAAPSACASTPGSTSSSPPASRRASRSTASGSARSRSSAPAPTRRRAC